MFVIANNESLDGSDGSCHYSICCSAIAIISIFLNKILSYILSLSLSLLVYFFIFFSGQSDNGGRTMA
jgi:hypothetical protein